MYKIFFISISSAILLLQACSSYQDNAKRARSLVTYSQYDKALQIYEEELKDSSRDILLYHMDKGMILHLAGKYKESNAELSKAEKLAEEFDAISVSQETAAILSNDDMKTYKGEDFEKVMLNAFMAMNYIMLGEYNEALVEGRRVNNKLTVIARKQGQSYTEDPFARYITAALYEATGELNHAYVDYKLIYKEIPNFPMIKNDLLRITSLLGFRSDYLEWKNKFGKEFDPDSIKGKGELIVLLAAGEGPEKIATERDVEVSQYGSHTHVHGAGNVLFPIPKFRKRNFDVYGLTIEEDGRQIAQTEVIQNLDDVAIKNLDDRIGREIAVAITRLVAKAAVADQVEQNFGPLAGFGAKVFFIMTQKADTRSWLLLPAKFAVARMFLPEGKHDLVLKNSDEDGTSVGGSKKISVEIKKGKKTFLVERRFD